MQIEYEVKFTAIDPQALQQRLTELGAECTKPKKLMRRLVFENPLTPNSYLRIRDEWDKFTLTLKEVIASDHIEWVKELELEVSSFDSMKMIVNKLGLIEKAYQETYRETWIKDGVQFTIDERPGLQPFIEIEGDSEKTVKEYSRLLGFDYSQAVFGTVSDIYLLELGIKPEIINYMPRITFEEPPLLFIPVPN